MAIRLRPAEVQPQTQALLPVINLHFRQHRRGDTVTQYVNRRTPHIKEMVDAHQQQNTGNGNIEAWDSCSQHHQRGTGTPAIPFDASIRVNIMTVISLKLN